MLRHCGSANLILLRNYSICIQLILIVTKIRTLRARTNTIGWPAVRICLRLTPLLTVPLRRDTDRARWSTCSRFILIFNCTTSRTKERHLASRMVTVFRFIDYISFNSTARIFSNFRRNVCQRTTNIPLNTSHSGALCTNLQYRFH